MPSLCVIVVGPHSSVAVADPNAALISLAAGLQPSDVDVPFAVISGGVRSSIHLAVLDTVAVLPHPSLAVKVLTWSRAHPVLITGPSLCVTVGMPPQLSVAVAVPSALLISLADGLHPRKLLMPPDVSTGGVTSSIQLTVRDAVDVLPHPSLAIQDLVCVL